MNWQIIILSVITCIIGVVFLVKVSQPSPTLYQVANSFLWGIAFSLSTMATIALIIMQYIDRGIGVLK